MYKIGEKRKMNKAGCCILHVNSANNLARRVVQLQKRYVLLEEKKGMRNVFAQVII